MSVNGRSNGMTAKVSFFTTEETTRLDLDDHYWVELKRELDYGEENELEGAAIRANVGLGGPNGAAPSLEYSVGNQRELMLALYILDWNLTDGNGKAVALPESLPGRQQIVRHLRPRWASRIVTRINQLRVESASADTISLEGVDGVEVDPTEPGDASETATPSPSDAGSAESVTAMSSEPRPVSSGRRSR